MNKLTWIAVIAAVSLSFAGCSSEAQDKYSEAGEDVGSATSKTGQAVAADAENAKTSADNALMTSKVKSALQSASGLETKGIDVDSNTETMTITLNGSVPAWGQKNQAENVAKGIAGEDFKVVNNLRIEAK